MEKERGSEEEDGEEGEIEAVRKRMERKDEKCSEEEDYFDKFLPTMPSVVLENRSIRMFSLLSICTKETTLV
jgi:hypothetical protein